MSDKFGTSVGGGRRTKVGWWTYLKNYVNILRTGTAVHKRTVLDMQLKTWFYDDFFGDVLADQWNLVTGSAGTAALISAINGKVQLDDTASEDDAGIDWGSFYPFDPTLNCVMEVKALVNTITNLNLILGFYKDADEYAYFHVDDADDNIDYAASLNGGVGAVDADSGVDITTSDIIYRIECYTDGSVKFYLDNVLVGTAPAGTLSTTPGVGHKPYILITDKTGQTTQHTFDIDYVFIHQDRV